MIKVRKLKERLTAVVQLAFDLVLGFDNIEGKQIWLLNVHFCIQSPNYCRPVCYIKKRIYRLTKKKACGCVISLFFVQKN